MVSDRDPATVAGAASVRDRGAATNLRLETLEEQAPNGPPLVTFECVPALFVKILLRHVPRPLTLTYVLLTYVLEMPENWAFLRDIRAKTDNENRKRNGCN